MDQVRVLHLQAEAPGIKQEGDDESDVGNCKDPYQTAADGSSYWGIADAEMKT